MEGYYTFNEIQKMGFKSIGNDVRISKKACFYNPASICIGNHVRIDDYCVFVGNIVIQDYIHIGLYSSFHASKHGKIVMEDYSGVSSNVTIYASSDSFDGEWMTCRPGVPEECTNVIYGEVILGKYSQIGTGSVVLPRGSLGEGTAVGAMSLVNKPLNEWYIYAGVPCRVLKQRSKRMLEFIK